MPYLHFDGITENEKGNTYTSFCDIRPPFPCGFSFSRLELFKGFLGRCQAFKSMTTSSRGIVVKGTPPLRGKGSWRGSGYQREPRPGPVAISRAVVPLSRPA